MNTAPRQLMPPSSNVSAKSVVNIQDATTKIKEIITRGIMNNLTQDDITKELNSVIASACSRVDLSLREEVRRALVNSARKWNYELNYSLNVHKQNLNNQLLRFGTQTSVYSSMIREIMGGPPGEIIERVRPFMTHNAKGIALIEGYQSSVKLAIQALASDPPISTKLKKDGTPVKVSLRNRAEMAARYAANAEDVNRFVTSGVKLVWASSHPNCSPRCEPHQGKLYSLDGTSGTTVEGYTYTPLEDVLKLNSGNSIINGYNCRHRLVEYFPNSHPPTDYTKKEIEREYQIDQRQRYYENTIRNLKTEEKLLRTSGDKEGASLARLKWRAMNKNYEAYSLRNNRAYYPWRTRITEDEREYYSKDANNQLNIQKNEENLHISVDNDKNGGIIDIEEQIQDREIFKNAIKNGELLLELHQGRQDKHILGSNNYNPEKNKSIVTITHDEIENLVSKNYGTGQMQLRKLERSFSYKETLTSEKNIGLWSDLKNNEYIPTNRFTIHYSKKGYHIVPSKPKKDGEKQ